MALLRMTGCNDALQDVKKQAEVMSWLMFQMGGLGPMQGQVGLLPRLSV